MPLIKGQLSFRIALLPGDAHGSQLASCAEQILHLIEHVRPDVAFQISRHDFGGVALAAGHLSALPTSTLEACRQSDASIVCACGDSKYGIEPENGLLALRRELGLFANIRPVKFPSDSLIPLSSYKPESVEGLDITFFRDLTGGAYYGEKQEAGEDGESYDTTSYSRSTIERLARLAGTYAMHFNPSKRVHSVDKANVMATSRLWRSVVTEVFSNEYPQVQLDHVLVDNAAMILSSDPQKMNGIILTENMFGDILSDQASGILKSPDILSSAAVSTIYGKGKAPGVFEPFNLKPRDGEVNPLGIIQSVGLMLEISLGLKAEATALLKAVRRTLDPIDQVGSDTRTTDLGGTASPKVFMDTLLHNFDYYLEALNSADTASFPVSISTPLSPQSSTSARPMGVIEKILTHAGIGLTKPYVETGDMICVKVDWTLTSELLWGGMEKTYNQMGRPRPFRNDRLWLAVDHTVDPRTNHQPRQKGLIAKAERFRREAKIIDFLPANTSIMHTDFTRERAQPGRVVVGSDSHTCSAGSMGSFAVGFGAADVVMPMVTGETWFRVPEVCRINFVGKLPFGVGGKDVILHILGLFKRNTIAFQRAVEYGGPGLKELSMDARFAIANMTTEFGGMGTCFEADEETSAWISRRKLPEHREGGLFFRADPDAQYVDVKTIDLSEVRLTMALHPNPDDVVPIHEKAGMKLDGCFIGACTTTEEDLIVGALVLEAGLYAGMRPSRDGKRRVTPGSLIIIKNLDKHGLLDIYRQAGFEVGVPGCSYCVGINDVDVAGEGEVWLSSQNRNFRNRMGKGSFGNITCAAAVAASSFDMVVTDPKFLLDQLDSAKLERLVSGGRSSGPQPVLRISEPRPEMSSNSVPVLLSSTESDVRETTPRIIRSKVQRFGENVDTDAIIPAEFMPGVDNADLGSHSFQYFRPEFRDKVTNGSTIIGSSREDAVRALQGAGVEAVIAKGFAFIYERNQLNMGLFSIKIQDPRFYELAQEDSVITINKDNKTIHIEGSDITFPYMQSEVEEALVESGGVLPLYSKLGKGVFRHLTAPKIKGGSRAGHGNGTDSFSSRGSADISW
ncbi:putative aconitate hydratase [Fusarium oxysporum f. sp. matthiolae]|nr:putative aconitate hydratase [Fusarium oxysporum f. sp. matthiolae]